jgi:hypothetical protein
MDVPYFMYVVLMVSVVGEETTLANCSGRQLCTLHEMIGSSDLHRHTHTRKRGDEYTLSDRVLVSS